MEETRCRVLEFGSQEQLESIALRREVLRKPIGLDFTEEELAAEDKQYHVACIQDDAIMGILLLKAVDKDVLKMRQVAVSSLSQGKGLGSIMVKFSEEWAVQNGFSFIELNARKTAVDFYLRLGYTLEGNEFMEVGIPHYRMTKKLL